MAGFIRRYTTVPGNEVLTQIEGVVIIDLPPPGIIAGLGTGVVGLVGEFADMSLAIAASSAGVISTRVVPAEVRTSQEMLDLFGGFDPTLGQFGVALGNGFAAVRNKRFSRLVLAAVNLCSAQGARFWRQLPVCRAQTDANAAVPVSGATIEAGREFRVGAAKIKIGQRVDFTARAPITQATGGQTVSGGSAATQVFRKSGYDWSTIDRGDGTTGARKGDILVIGNDNSGALQPSSEAGTYRVASDAASGTDVVVEKLDGSSFAWGANANVPFRLHHSTDADSARERVVGSSVPGGYAIADAGGCTVGVRPLTDSTGAQSDGTISAASLLSPASAPAAITGNSADPLSGLGGVLHVSTATSFTAALQKANAENDSTLDAAYATAIDAFVSEDLPAREVNILLAARKSSTIRTTLKTDALARSQNGRGMTTPISPELSVQTTSAAVADADPGVGGHRHERVDYSWPGCTHFVPEAVGYLLGTADGDFTDDGILDDTFDVWLASILSNLAPERNPGQAEEPVPTILAPVLGFQRGVSGLAMSDYISMRQAGIAGLRLDPTVGPTIQSGITTSLTSGQKNIARRRMADFIQDSVAARLVQLAKLPMTEDFKDTVLSEVTSFLEDLRSVNNPKAQRISDYSVDGVSGNTQQREALGIYTVIGKVRTLATADTIVFQTEIGEGVVIVRSA